MKKEIEVLVRMQLFDDEIAEHLLKIAELPKTLANLQSNSKDSYESVKNIENEIDLASKTQKAKELDIRENNEKIAKYAYQQNEVKTNKEYKALNSEIDHLKKRNIFCDDEIIDAMEKEAELKESLKGAKKIHKEAKDELNAREDKINDKIRELEDTVAKLRLKRNTIAREIPLAILKRYAALIKHKNRKAVVYNENNACSGCGFSVRPQVTIELAKGKNFNCENCGRFLIDKSIFAELKNK